MIENSFICGECELTFNRVEQLVDHTRLKHTTISSEQKGDHKGLIKCDNCKDTFTSLNILTRHRRIALMGGNLNCNLHLSESKFNDHMKVQKQLLIIGNETTYIALDKQPRKKLKKKKIQ